MNIRWNVILGVIALCALAWFYSLNQETADLSELVKNQIVLIMWVIKWKQRFFP